MGSALPYRIDLLDDEIESIRTFDVDTQRSIYKVNEVRLLPAREFPLDEDGRTRFRQSFRERFEGDPSRAPLYKDVSNGVAPAGHRVLPAAVLRGHGDPHRLPAGTTARSACTATSRARVQFWRDTSRATTCCGRPHPPVLPPHELFLASDEFFGAVKPYPAHRTGRRYRDRQTRLHHCRCRLCRWTAAPPIRSRCSTVPRHLPGRVAARRREHGPARDHARVPRRPRAAAGSRDTFAAFRGAADPLMLTVAPLSNGFALPGAGIAVVTENELYAASARTRGGREARAPDDPEGMLRDLSEVKVGDPVVHESHGIGRYLGLITMDLGDGATEFLTLEYDGGDKLYVPVVAAAADQPLQPAGAGERAAAQARQRRLGEGEAASAAKQVRDTAAELLQPLRAARRAPGPRVRAEAAGLRGLPRTASRSRRRPTSPPPSRPCIKDLESGKPMDRLICGDVGFGKTEVALRAAFVAVADGKQVAVLVPTTLLAEQHFHTFSDRFADWPVKLAELSRFRSAKESERSAERPRRRHDRHRHRHPQAAVEGREVQEPGPRDHRRGAPLRRAPEGTAQGSCAPKWTC